ncbi:hypothetical protein D3C78_1888010 [compost metagenome]
MKLSVRLLSCSSTGLELDISEVSNTFLIRVNSFSVRLVSLFGSKMVALLSQAMVHLNHFSRRAAT